MKTRIAICIAFAILALGCSKNGISSFEMKELREDRPAVVFGRFNDEYFEDVCISDELNENYVSSHTITTQPFPTPVGKR